MISNMLRAVGVVIALALPAASQEQSSPLVRQLYKGNFPSKAEAQKLRPYRPVVDEFKTYKLPHIEQVE